MDRTHKSKSLEQIEEKMADMDANSMRYKVLRAAKGFKTSWIDLGQILYTVWKDKLYKNWGFSAFEAYSAKEIGIRKETALKLLRSYSFLEKEEPKYLAESYREEANVASIPNYESVNLLRLASNKKDMDHEDYNKIKKYVLEKGTDVKEVKKDLTQMIRQREELDGEEAWQKKRLQLLKRLLGTLRSVSDEIRVSKLLPAKMIKDIEGVIEKIETEIK